MHQVKPTIYVIGVFDVLHAGHFNLLYRSKNLLPDNRLIVGICSDQLTAATKQATLYDQTTRKNMMQSLDIVDQVVIYDHMDHSSALLKHSVDIFVVPPEYGNLDGHASSLQAAQRLGVQVVRLDRTPNISSTQLKSMLNHL
jgi:cytidyltransferase-like protein